VFLHARNMHDFLTNKTNKQDDIIADHFVKSIGGKPRIISLTHTTSLMPDILKFRNHLTYSRVNFKRTKWQPKEIQNILE
jgi:hypothetical protein